MYWIALIVGFSYQLANVYTAGLRIRKKKSIKIWLKIGQYKGNAIKRSNR